jgi:hypothetical protein
MTCKNDAPGMKWCRSRNDDGQLREKRWDTHMGTIEKKYERNFWVRSDMHLDTYLKKIWEDSLNNIIDWK